MYLGRIVELAPDDMLYNDPIHPYSKALLSAIPIPDPDIKKQKIILKGDIPSPLDPPSGCTFHTRCTICDDICSQKTPDFREIKTDHWVACHLA